MFFYGKIIFLRQNYWNDSTKPKFMSPWQSFLAEKVCFFEWLYFFLQVCFSGIKFFMVWGIKFMIRGIEVWGAKFCFLQEQIFLPAEVNDFLRMIMVTQKSLIYKILRRNFWLPSIQSPLRKQKFTVCISSIHWYWKYNRNEDRQYPQGINIETEIIATDMQIHYQKHKWIIRCC